MAKEEKFKYRKGIDDRPLTKVEFDWIRSGGTLYKRNFDPECPPAPPQKHRPITLPKINQPVKKRA